MSDIFRIDTSDNIKLTGGSQNEGICISTDTRDVRTRTELESGAQNAGGNDSTPDGGGISSVFVEGCLTGSGTEALPISVIIDPTGGISCGPNGLLTTNLIVVTGVTASSIVTSGCMAGSGTPSSPAYVLINPTGGINCTVAGLALQQTYLTQAVTSGCVGGIGTAGSPIVLSINPTGGLHCTPGGLAVQFPAPTGLNNVNTSGFSLTGNGTLTSPLAVLVNPTGKIQITSAGIALQETYLTQAITSGCIGGIGTAGSPIVLSINPTGGLQCTAGGLALSTLVSATVPTGCLTGSGTIASPLSILLNPTGGLQCTAGGLAVNLAALSSTGTVCYAFSYETGTAPTSATMPTTPLTSLSSGNVQVEVYDNVIRFWAYNPSGFVLDKEFSGGGSGGSGTPGSPANSVQFNNGGSFGGSSNLTYNGSTLFVSGTTSSSVPALNVSQTWNGISNTAYSGVIFNFIDPSSASSVSKMLDMQVNGVSTINFQKNGTLSASYYVTPNASAAGLYARSNTAIVSLGVSDDVQLTRDAANALAQRRGTNSQVFYVYNNFISTGVYERAAIDWVGSPGVLQIGTQHAGSGVPRGLQLLTSGTPRIDVSAAGAIQFNSLYTFPQNNGSSGQVLTTNGAGTLTWATASGGGGGAAASPSGAIQFNNGTTFGGSSNLNWDNTNATLNVTGTITTKNITTIVYAITDSTGVDINPNDGSVQVWTLGGNRAPTANFFNPGQAVTLMIDDGSGNSIDWSIINPTWLDGAAPSLPVSGYGLVELWKVGSIIFGASLASGVSSGGGTPASPSNSIQFNNAGSFGGSSNLTWNGSTLSITGVTTSGAPALSVSQLWNGPASTSYSGVIFNFIDPSSASSTSKPFEVQVNGTGIASFNKAGDLTLGANGVGRILTASRLSYAGALELKHNPTTDDVRISTNTAGTPVLGFYNIGTALVQLHAEASEVLAQRRGTNAQALRVYNTYTSTGVYERGTFDWAGSPGVLQIGTQQAGTGSPRGLQLITNNTPRIDIAASGAIQFYGAYTFPSTNGASGQVLTTNGGGTLTWGNVSGAASSADYFVDETDEGNSGTSITINFASKANHKLTLTGHCTLAFTAPASARETKIRFVQGGTGGYAITLPSGTLGTTPVLPTGVGSQSVVSLFYDRDGNWHV